MNLPRIAMKPIEVIKAAGVGLAAAAPTAVFVIGSLCYLAIAAPPASSLQAPASPAKPAPGLTIDCKVVSVVDGDTIEVEVTRRCRVRLLDCWAPESRTSDPAEKKVGLAAKLHLAGVAIGKQARLFVPTADATRVGDVFTFDRVLGHVWLDGETETLSEHQVRAKFASTAKGRPLGQ